MNETTKELQALPEGVEADLGSRWAAWLHATYPRHAAKLIAAAWEVSPRTAQAWLDGQAPYARHLVRALRLHGLAVLGVLAPGTVLAQAGRVDALCADLETRIARVGAEIAVLRGER